MGYFGFDSLKTKPGFIKFGWQKEISLDYKKKKLARLGTKQQVYALKYV